MDLLRRIAIWFCGLVGGGTAMAALSGPATVDSPALGFIAGALLFICCRLWFREPPAPTR